MIMILSLYTICLRLHAYDEDPGACILLKGLLAWHNATIGSN